MNRHFWRATRCGLAWLAMAGAWIEGGTVARAAAAPAAMPPLIPVEDFARAPQYVDMQLSPDGVCVGYLVLQDDDSGLGFLSLDKMKAEVMMWGKKGNTLASKFNAVFGFQWVSPNRVVLYTALGWAGANRDFSNYKYLTGWGRRDDETHGRAGISSAADFYPVGVVPDARRDPSRVLVLNMPDTSNPEFRPDVFQMKTQEAPSTW